MPGDDYYVIYNGTRWLIVINNIPIRYHLNKKDAIVEAIIKASVEHVNVYWEDKEQHEAGKAIFRTPPRPGFWARLWAKFRGLA